VDAQTTWTAAVAVLSVVVAVVARVRRKAVFGLGLRGGAVGELARGALFSVPFLALLVAVLTLTGLSSTSVPAPLTLLPSLGIAAYFAVLFTVEEVLFRGLLMGGLGARTVALVVSSLLVAGAYAFAPGTSVLAVVGAVLANGLHGWARWRSGRIWWGLGQRWVWNTGMVVLGFANSGFALDDPVLRQDLDGPRWLTGGSFGIEGGVVGLAFLVVMTVAATRWATGRRPR
jgi:uncharacterized protein